MWFQSKNRCRIAASIFHYKDIIFCSLPFSMCSFLSIQISTPCPQRRSSRCSMSCAVTWCCCTSWSRPTATVSTNNRCCDIATRPYWRPAVEADPAEWLVPDSLPQHRAGSSTPLIALQPPPPGLNLSPGPVPMTSRWKPRSRSLMWLVHH